MLTLTNKKAKLLFREIYGDNSDSAWYKTKRVFDDAFPMTEVNVKWVAQIKKMLPRLNLSDIDVVTTVKMTNNLLNTPTTKITGEDFIKLLQKHQIEIHRNTRTNWFKTLEGFSKKRTYSLSELTPVILAAFSYKLKQKIKESL